MVLRSGTAIFELPTELDDRLAVSLNCAMATSVEALRDLPEPNQALVLGAGMVSLFAAWVLRERGWEVTVVDGAAGRREIASKIGLRSVESCEGSHRLVFEGAGSRDLLWSSYEHLRPGGEIRIVGLSHPESELGLTGQDILRRCWRVRGSHNYAPAALRAAMDLAVGFGRVAPLEMMFGPAWGLGAVNSALAEARLRRWMRSLVAP
jgi:D-arabinose 1-dehydrogenase-like Zn-dependent alcohol dehydrogenase